MAAGPEEEVGGFVEGGAPGSFAVIGAGTDSDGLAAAVDVAGEAVAHVRKRERERGRVKRREKMREKRERERERM